LERDLDQLAHSSTLNLDSLRTQIREAMTMKADLGLVERLRD